MRLDETEKECLSRIADSILKLKSSFIQLGVDTDKVEIILPLMDFEYLVRTFDLNRNSHIQKFIVDKRETSFKLAGIMFIKGDM